MNTLQSTLHFILYMQAADLLRAASWQRCCAAMLPQQSLSGPTTPSHMRQPGLSSSGALRGARQLLCMVTFISSLPNSAGVHSTVWMRAFSAATMSRAVWYSSSSLKPGLLCRKVMP